MNTYNENQIKLSKVKIIIKNKSKDIFDDLNTETKKILIDAKYDVLLDSDNILSFYPNRNTELANKVMESRINKSPL